jgi:uncharacterized protein YhfF
MSEPSETLKIFKFGWFGDGNLGERLIQKILSGEKSATSCPAYDPEDADLKVGDRLQLTDKHGKSRGILVVTGAEIRRFGDFDEELARKEGTTLKELQTATQFANGREVPPDEDMRIIYFALTK